MYNNVGLNPAKIPQSVNEDISYSMLILPLATIGFGIACTIPAATVAVIHAAPDGRFFW